MGSMIASGTWKNVLFCRRSSSSRERAPAMRLTCSTILPWRCIVLLKTFRSDSYWFTALSRARRRYWSVTSLMRLNSRTQNTPAFDSVVAGTLVRVRFCRMRPDSYPREIHPVSSARISLSISFHWMLGLPVLVLVLLA